MRQTCEELGIEFVDATAPDPTGDAGLSGAQQFILEDVPKMVDKYGKDTAFFSTNCAMQIPLVKATFGNRSNLSSTLLSFTFTMVIRQHLVLKFLKTFRRNAERYRSDN